MIINSFLLKIINIPASLWIKLSPKFNRWKFCAKGVNIGENCLAIGNIYITGNGKISIGNDFCMTSGSCINPISSNLMGVFFTETENSHIDIGNHVGMSSTRIWAHDSVKIGDNVKIGANVLLIDTDTHQLDYILRRDLGDDVFEGLSIDEIIDKKKKGTKSSPIIVENDVWIGAHSIILKGVTIGERTIIGAGSVVTKSIPPDCIAAGNPCKIIRHR